MRTTEIFERIRKIEKQVDSITLAYDTYLEANNKAEDLITSTLSELEKKVEELNTKLNGQEKTKSNKSVGYVKPDFRPKPPAKPKSELKGKAPKINWEK